MASPSYWFKQFGSLCFPLFLNPFAPGSNHKPDLFSGNVAHLFVVMVCLESQPCVLRMPQSKFVELSTLFSGSIWVSANHLLFLAGCLSLEREARVGESRMKTRPNSVCPLRMCVFCVLQQRTPSKSTHATGQYTFLSGTWPVRWAAFLCPVQDVDREGSVQTGSFNHDAQNGSLSPLVCL